MAKEPVYADYAYMTFDDIRHLSPDSKDTIIAIKAPIGAKIEIPDSEQLERMYREQGESDDSIKKYQIYLSSD